MIETIKEVRSIVNFEELEMRIGIHTVFVLFFFLKYVFLFLQTS